MAKAGKPDPWDEMDTELKLTVLKNLHEKRVGQVEKLLTAIQALHDRVAALETAMAHKADKPRS